MPYSHENPNDSTFYAAFGAFTPLPNVFMDHAMPVLTDTEWRLLCVVTRATLGWAQNRGNSDERKTRDWLTHSQLIVRTGRSSEAVSRALKTLVASHLVEVQNERGSLLLTPQERRRNGGRLFYSLHSDAKKGALALRSSKQTFSPERPRLDGTTKETVNKKLPDGNESEVDVLELETEFWNNKPSPNPDVRRFLRAYRRRLQEWQAESRSASEPRFVWGREGQIAAQLLKTHDYFGLLEKLDLFLAKQTRRSASMSLTAFNQSLQITTKPRRKTTDRFQTVRHGRWIRAARVERRGRFR